MTASAAEYEAYEKSLERFGTAATGAPPTDAQRSSVTEIRDRVVELATAIELELPDGRNKALALTALEDVHMRANRAIFQEGPSR